MLVKKGDLLIREHEDNTATPYEVLLADDEFFCLGMIEYDPETKETRTSFEYTEIYSNDKSINTLEQLGFAKVKKS